MADKDVSNVDDSSLWEDFESILNNLEVSSPGYMSTASSPVWNTTDMDNNPDDLVADLLLYNNQSLCSQMNGEETSRSYDYTDMRLSDEEKEMLAQQNIVLPSNMPLTKKEESALRCVRRKIRNKMSAKESRKRKQDYVGELEKRVKTCTMHNVVLQNKVDNLEQQNLSLMAELTRFQTLMAGLHVHPVQASTCIMVLLLSFALVSVPNFNIFSTKPGPSVDLSNKERSGGEMGKLFMLLPPRSDNTHSKESKTVEESQQCQFESCKHEILQLNDTLMKNELQNSTSLNNEQVNLEHSTLSDNKIEEEPESPGDANDNRKSKEETFVTNELEM